MDFNDHKMRIHNETRSYVREAQARGQPLTEIADPRVTWEDPRVAEASIPGSF